MVFDLDSSVNDAATGNTNDSGTNTYFFGSGGGADTISFANTSTNSGGVADFTIAVDSSFGLAATQIKFNSSTSLINIGTGTGASIFISGLTGTTNSTNQAVTNLGFTLTTVSSSVITALG